MFLFSISRNQWRTALCRSEWVFTRYCLEVKFQITNFNRITHRRISVSTHFKQVECNWHDPVTSRNSPSARTITWKALISSRRPGRYLTMEVHFKEGVESQIQIETSAFILNTASYNAGRSGCAITSRPVLHLAKRLHHFDRFFLANQLLNVGVIHTHEDIVLLEAVSHDHFWSGKSSRTFSSPIVNLPCVSLFAWENSSSFRMASLSSTFLAKRTFPLVYS